MRSLPDPRGSRPLTVLPRGDFLPDRRRPPRGHRHHLKMSVVPHQGRPAAVATLMALFAQIAAHVVPALLIDTAPPPERTAIAAVRRLTGSVVVPEAQQAARLLRQELARPWPSSELAFAVALSRSQLSRRCTAGFGVAPMRWLTETRLAEFTRLLEETTLPVDAAARAVGWQDRRVAAAWFRRRYGISLAEFRKLPPPVCAGEAPCILCLGRVAEPIR